MFCSSTKDVHAVDDLTLCIEEGMPVCDSLAALIVFFFFFFFFTVRAVMLKDKEAKEREREREREKIRS